METFLYVLYILACIWIGLLGGKLLAFVYDFIADRKWKR